MMHTAQFPGSSAVRSIRAARGFTLLELCFVMVIIALILGGVMPAIQTAFSEKDVRDDTQEIALMVKTAMFRAAEQHRAYVIEVTARSVALHPADAPAADADQDTSSDSDDDDDSNTSTAPENVVITQQISSANALFLPDPDKPGEWLPVPAKSTVEWTFAPGELCPAPRIRMTRGEAWLEMSFNALTGDVENESLYFP